MAKRSAKSKGYRKTVGKKPYLTKRDIVILCLLVAVVAVGAILLFSYDDGALKVKDGKIVDAGENWLIVNGSNTPGRARYFKVGEIQAPEGYDGSNAPLNDDNVPMYVYTPQEEANGVEAVNVTTSHSSAKALAEYIVETMTSLGSERLSEVTAAETGGRSYYYFTNRVIPNTDEAEEAEEAADTGDAEVSSEEAEGAADAADTEANSDEAGEAADVSEDEAEAGDTAPQYVATLNAYMDCAHDSCVAIEVRATADAEEDLLDEAALKAVAEQTLAGVTLEEK